MTFTTNPAVSEPTPFRMPARKENPSILPFGIDLFVHNLRSFDPAVARKEYPWADRFVVGLPLAPWQRSFKWTTEQRRSFITSAWTGIHLGVYMMTSADYRVEDAGFKGIEYKPFSNMILDGQQRLMSIELYLTDGLAVPDAAGKLALWSYLGRVERRRFEKVIFGRGEIHERDETKLRQFYDQLNFGGTPHEPHERATLKNDETNAGTITAKPRPMP